MREVFESGVFIGLVFLLVLVLPSAWLIRRWRSRWRRTRELGEFFGRPYSGPTSFHLSFMSTHQDLMNAYAAGQVWRSGLVPSDRIVLLALGLFWIGCVVVLARLPLFDLKTCNFRAVARCK